MTPVHSGHDNCIRAWVTMGDVRAALGQPKDAAAAHARALALAPQDALGWFSQGRALIGLRRYPTALDAITRVLTLDPEDADTWRLKAKAITALVELHHARQAIKKAARKTNRPRGRDACIYRPCRFSTAAIRACNHAATSAHWASGMSLYLPT